MDNDNKVIIQKPEVELFLQEDVYAFNREKPKMYDLDKEFEAVRKNKKHTILWPLIIMFIISILLTVGITYYIRYQNRQISVNVDVFEDINLRKLLDMVSNIENQLEETQNAKHKSETKRTRELETALAEKEAELITVKSLPISSKEKNARIAEIETKYEDTVQEINTRYDNEIAMLEISIQDLQEQLNAYDSANIERAQQQQAAIDSQRQLFEIEKQQLTENYESTIASLQDELTEMKLQELTMKVKITEEIAAQYQGQYAALQKEYSEKLAALDPIVNDPKYLEVLNRVKSYDTPVNDNLDNNVENQPENQVESLEQIENLENAGNLENSENAENQPVENSQTLENTETTENLENTRDVEILENSTEKINDEDVSLESSNETIVEETLTLQERLVQIQNVPEYLRADYENLLLLSKDYETATELLLSIPQENDIPEYVVALEFINSKMNNKLLDLYYDLSEEYYTESTNLKYEKDAIESQLKKEKASLQRKVYEEQNKNLELKDTNATLNKIYSYFETMALENGDAGYILDTTDKNKVLVYVSPLFKNEIDSTLAYVFRKSDELIGTLILIEENDFYYGIPSTDDVALALKPGDKILLDVKK